MKWYALYRDGELLGVKQWFGKPTVRDFGIGEMVGAAYTVQEVKEVERVEEGPSLIVPVKA